MKGSISLFLGLFMTGGIAAAQPALSLKRADGLTVTVINATYPLLKVLLPGQPPADRGIIRHENYEVGYLVMMSVMEHNSDLIWR